MTVTEVRAFKSATLIPVEIDIGRVVDVENIVAGKLSIATQIPFKSTVQLLLVDNAALSVI